MIGDIDSYHSSIGEQEKASIRSELQDSESFSEKSIVESRID